MHRQTNGAAIRAIRLALGIPQQDLAVRAGISPSHMCKIEQGAEQPAPDTGRRLADGLGVPLEAITYVIPELQAETA